MNSPCAQDEKALPPLRGALRVRAVFVRLQQLVFCLSYAGVSGLKDLRSSAEKADYSGMSNAEIVMAIYDRWDQAFGDFRRAAAVGIQSLGGMQTAAQKIMLQFYTS